MVRGCLFILYRLAIYGLNYSQFILIETYLSLISQMVTTPVTNKGDIAKSQRFNPSVGTINKKDTLEKTWSSILKFL
jgi:hypothetical protein